jgi:YHS domain-containing protein
MAKLLDPVCGMTVDETALRAPGHDDVAFCAPGCRTSFLKDPSAYPSRLNKSESTASSCGCGHDETAPAESAPAIQISAGPQPVASGSACCGGNGS